MDFAILIIVVTSFLELSVAFPENLIPKSTYKDVSLRVFAGNENSPGQKLQFLQMMKPMVIAGIKRIAIASRENVYFLDTKQFSSTDSSANITHSEFLSWKSTRKTTELCLRKGQSKELCHNYLSVVETSNSENLLLCGTNSYAPMCTNYKVAIAGRKLSLVRQGPALSGKQRSPFGPDQQSASLFTGGSLYSATFQSFFGSTPLVFRSLGAQPSLRTSTTHEPMNEPKFVKMSEDDKRILVYFNEVQELVGGEKRTVAQVAQVCKNDMGGDRVLTRMFTTFIKARLNCSYHGFYLDELRDVTDPVTVNGQSVLFATFATPQSSLPGSAVCAFTFDSMRSSLSGPFLNSRTSTGSPPAPSRHPGKCPGDTLTDDELIFIKTHPQMEKQVTGSLLMTYYGQRWAAVAVDVNAGPYNVEVVFVGTDHGHLIRFLPSSGRVAKGAIISDQDVYDEKRCSFQHHTDVDRKVVKIVLEGNVVLVAFKHCVVAVPLSSCGAHRCKEACLASADPYCGWNGNKCVAFNHPDQHLEQNITLASTDVRKLCPDIASEVHPNEEVKENVNITEKTLAPPKFQPAEQENNRNEVAFQQSSENLYSHTTLICVGIVTFAATVFFLIVTVILLRYCCCKQQSLEEAYRKKIEDGFYNSDEKQGSLSQKAGLTYRGWQGWLYKVISPSPTPLSKNEPRPPLQRRGNDYSKAPTLKQKDVDEAKKRRSTSSRLASVSSSASRQSRQDVIGYFPTSQSLLTPTSETGCPASYAELTLPKHIADAPTLRLMAKPTSDSPSSGASTGSPIGSSPFYPESGAGAAETGVLPTASAKLRRRNERAASQTNEIMRESDSAIRELETALLHMEEHGLMAAQQPAHSRVIRERLDSNDSGKGESPRNSLRTDLEQPVSVITSQSRLQRPTSLSIQTNPSNRRRRLLSEGSRPRDPGMQVMVLPRTGRDWPANTPHSSRSQPTTPEGGFEKLGWYQPIHHSNAEVYATLPKNGCVNSVPTRRKHQQQPLEQLFQHPNFSNCLQQQMFIPNTQLGIGYGPTKLQRPHSVSEPKRQNAASLSCVSPVKPHPNFYPSLQVRGVHAQKMPHQQPQNHFTSLPRQASASHQVANHLLFTAMPGFEQPVSSNSRKKVSSAVRQTSMPGSIRPVICIPSPTASNTGAA